MIKHNRLLFKETYVHISEFKFKEYTPRESLHKDVLGVAGGLSSFNEPFGKAYVFSANKNGSAISWGSFESKDVNPQLLYGDIFFILEDLDGLEKGKYYKLR